MNLLFNNKVDQYKESIDRTLATLLDITKKIGHDELGGTVADIKNRIHDPYMFVIVGEVKAGKSSFINALLESKNEICKVAPSPMTDTIQQIVYGAEESITEITPHLKRITFPEEILKEVAIVDTPGTNTIAEYHQDITESFIPASDLIVFVFESKNPYRESAWKFLDFIKEEWRKKIIFILQQKDLMELDDLKVNMEGVRTNALSRGISEPIVFAVSAKQELDGDKAESGFSPVRNYINDHITGGKAPYLKLLNNAQTSLTINDKIYSGLDIRKLQYQKDREFRNEITEILQSQNGKTTKHINILVENLIAKYNRITSKYEAQLSEGFSFVTMMKRSFKSKFNSKEKNVKEWINGIFTDLETELNSSLRERIQDGVVDIADDIQDMAKLVDAKIKASETILKNNHEIYADIADRRANILKDLQRTFSDFMSKKENFYSDDMHNEGDKVIPNIAAGSGAALIGLILATVTSGTVLDVTGGILTAVGLAFAGVSVGMNRRKILNQYRSEVDKGREHIKAEVTEKLVDYTGRIRERIDSNFYQFDEMLQTEEEMIQYLEDSHITVKQEIGELVESIKTNLPRLS